MKRNGRNSSGRIRWRCGRCGASSTQKRDNRAADLEKGLIWLFSKDGQASDGTTGRTATRYPNATN
ncbi:hypothetical protein [Bifidobacterium sp. ESL0764]|uniref:hypothetical protein n=1 Tax=Bifidobacterium sp. ESL0764 TaxID=2983228 RepID=UPI0023F62554|nr:hypothetical protein [Bifidobacterium sp. ESL0764]WEV66656.1 hypothetical protein OZX71_01215 [Bifidobacterium sp. ESL0764]